MTNRSCHAENGKPPSTIDHARGTSLSEICASVHAPSETASTMAVPPRDMIQSSGPAVRTSRVYRTSTSVSEYVRWHVITWAATSAASLAGVAAAAHGVPSTADAAANVSVSPTVSTYRNRARLATLPSLTRAAP